MNFLQPSFDFLLPPQPTTWRSHLLPTLNTTCTDPFSFKPLPSSSFLLQPTSNCASSYLGQSSLFQPCQAQQAPGIRHYYHHHGGLHHHHTVDPLTAISAHSQFDNLAPGRVPTLLPDLGFSPSPSDTCSSDAPPSPVSTPESQDDNNAAGHAKVHIVQCNAPLVAPVPLPRHLPTLFQCELPDIDEDLSHPPYIMRPPKRKREEPVSSPLDLAGKVSDASQEVEHVYSTRSRKRRIISMNAAAAPTVSAVGSSATPAASSSRTLRQPSNSGKRRPRQPLSRSAQRRVGG